MKNDDDDDGDERRLIPIMMKEVTEGKPGSIYAVDGGPDGRESRLLSLATLQGCEIYTVCIAYSAEIKRKHASTRDFG